MKAPPKQIGLLLLLVAGLLMPGLVGTSHASAVSGQFTVWSYLKDDSVDHAMIVPSLTLNAYQLGHRDLSFQTTLRGFSDMRNGESTNEQVRIQRALLLYTPRGSKWQVRAGQQWISEGVGRGNIAGLWAKVSPCPKGSLTAYVGSKTAQTVYLDEEDGDNTDDGLAAGLRIQRRFGKYTTAASWTYLTKDGDVRFHGAGLDGSSKLSKDLMLRARLHMNVEQSSIETAQLVAAWDACKRLQLTGELRSQTPRVYEDSYFARFLEEASSNHARGSARWTFYDTHYVTGSGYAVFTEEDVLYKVKAGLGDENAEVGYTHWLSVAEGDMDGFYGMLYGDLDVNNRVVGKVFAGFDFARGSNSTIRPNTESQSVYFGAEYDALKWLSITAKAEHVRDQRHNSDWRGLGGITWKFSTLRGR